MSIGVLDINDSNLQLWHEGTTVQSPGYVLFQEKEYRFGCPHAPPPDCNRGISTRGIGGN